jgi:hypothetical protein
MSNQGIPTRQVVKRLYLNIVEDINVVEDLDVVEDLNADAQKVYSWYCESLTPNSIAASIAEFRDI